MRPIHPHLCQYLLLDALDCSTVRSCDSLSFFNSGKFLSILYLFKYCIPPPSPFSTCEWWNFRIYSSILNFPFLLTIISSAFYTASWENSFAQYFNLHTCSSIVSILKCPFPLEVTPSWHVSSQCCLGQDSSSMVRAAGVSRLGSHGGICAASARRDHGCPGPSKQTLLCASSNTSS